MADIPSENNTLRGIGGWLLIPAFISVTAPIFHALAGFEVFNLGSRIPSKVRSAFYLDAMISFVLVGVFVYALYLLWQHKREYPAWFIAGLAVGVAKVLLLTFLMASNGISIGEAGRDFVNAAIPAAIWIPYMLKSKRVKATFVN